ncbi:MAG: hypothetical protein E6230_12080 [Paenibacillus dendritiformis]|nr:hypothetical protein [Paenibacillus dendritiformis]MDU5142919.1 hypothetical protein [Paenibacillus dendritiformis]
MDDHSEFHSAFLPTHRIKICGLQTAPAGANKPIMIEITTSYP